MDYYDTLEYDDGAVSKYTYLTYLRTNINLALCHDIDDQYDLLNKKCFDDIREENYQILDEIVELVKKLYGFKVPSDEEDKYLNERWKE